MEEETNGMKIEVYGNMSEKTYNDQQILIYLVNKYDK